ncbi:hypothetical protein THAOC_28767, partial [Thalassiosira oceanica]
MVLPLPTATTGLVRPPSAGAASGALSVDLGPVGGAAARSSGGPAFRTPRSSSDQDARAPSARWRRQSSSRLGTPPHTQPRPQPDVTFLGVKWLRFGRSLSAFLQLHHKSPDPEDHKSIRHFSTLKSFGGSFDYNPSALFGSQSSPDAVEATIVAFQAVLRGLWLTALRSVLAYLPWDVWLFSDFSTGIVLHIPGIEDGHPGVCSGVITPQYKRFKRGGRQLIWVTTRFGSALPGPFWTSFLFGLWLCVDLLATSTREFLCCRFGSLRASALTIFGLLAECSGSPLGVADGPDFSDVDDAVLVGRGPASVGSAPRGRLCHPTPPAEAVSDDVRDTEPSPFVLDWASDWFILLQVLLCFGLPILWTLRRSDWWHLAFDSLVLLVTFGGLQTASFRTFEHGDVTRLESPHLLAYDLAYTFVFDALSAL